MSASVKGVLQQHMRGMLREIRMTLYAMDPVHMGHNNNMVWGSLHTFKVVRTTAANTILAPYARMASSPNHPAANLQEKSPSPERSNPSH